MSIKLLIIETGSFFKQSLGARLEGEGFCLFSAERRADAKKIIGGKKIDVAILDLSGLKREGLQILETIKGLNASPEVITINNAEQMSLSIDGMKLGAFDDFLVPLDIRALIDRIRCAARQKEKAGRKRRTFFEKYQDAMAAAAFAEAGETEQAINFLDNSAKEKKSRKGENHGEER